jgi:hypothetical protein
MILSVLVSWMNLIKCRACSSLKTMICSCCSVCVFSGGIFGGGGNCLGGREILLFEDYSGIDRIMTAFSFVPPLWISWWLV